MEIIQKLTNFSIKGDRKHLKNPYANYSVSLQMLSLRLHKWFISLALIVSFVSFNGYTNNTVTVKSSCTELFIAKKPVSKTATYYYGIVKPNIPSNFSFKAFLKSFNLIDGLQFETVKNKALQYVSYLHFKTISHTFNQNDCIVSSWDNHITL